MTFRKIVITLPVCRCRFTTFTFSKTGFHEKHFSEMFEANKMSNSRQNVCLTILWTLFRITAIVTACLLFKDLIYLQMIRRKENIGATISETVSIVVFCFIRPKKFRKNI